MFQNASYTVNGKPMFAQAAGPKDAPGLLLLPGSPSRWHHLKLYLEADDVTQRFRAVAVDRPGYGNSVPGVPHPSLEGQAALLQPLIDELAAQGPVTVVGHSYGGSLAAYLALSRPEQVESSLLLAPLLDPGTVTFSTARKMGGMLGGILARSLRVCIGEMNALSNELATVEPQWAGLQRPVTFVQGMKDFIAPPGHARFAEQALPQDKLQLLRLPKGSHFFPFTNKQLCVDLLLRPQEAMARVSGS